MITVGYEMVLHNNDETFEGIEKPDCGYYSACDTVERWYRDTYGEMIAYFNCWIEEDN